MCCLLREEYETSVVPGKFFEMPDHIRIGIGCDSTMLAGGVQRLSIALDELNAEGDERRFIFRLISFLFA